MIEVRNLNCADKKSYDICTKHINEHILAGVNYYIDTYGDNEDTRDGFNKESAFDDLFPKEFIGNRFEELLRIRSLILSEDYVVLMPAEKYILMKCLMSYYEDYDMEYALDIAAVVCVYDNKSFEEQMKSDTPDCLNIRPIKNVEDRFYVLKTMTDVVFEILDEADDDEASASNTLEFLMSQIEDLKNYAEICFEDEDYLLLGSYTREELLSHPDAAQMGLDV